MRAALMLVVATAAGPAFAQVVLKDSHPGQEVAPQALLRDLLAGRAPLVVDVRPAMQFAEGHIPGAVNVPHKQIPGRWEEFVPYKDRGIVVYCQRGLRSRYAIKSFAALGMRKVGVLEGYLEKWERLDYPLSQPSP